MRLFVHACLLFLLPTSVNGEPVNCKDDRGADRCSANAIAEQNSRFGLSPIAKMAISGSWVQRAVFVDGYGNDLLAISFIRDAGSDAKVELRTANKGRPPLVAAIDPKIWDQVRQRSQYFDRPFAAEPGKATDLNFCLHSWVVRVEASEPARQSPNVMGHQILPPSTRAAVQKSCGDSLAVKFAFELASIAVETLPTCALIDAQHQRNDVTRLAACMQLNGDRISAARVYNVAQELRVLSNPNFAVKDSWQYVFAENVKVTVDGKMIGEGRSASKAFLNWAKPYPYVNFDFSSFSGIDADRVETEGIMSRRVDPNGDAEVASVLIGWTQRGDRAVIETMTIGAFRPLSAVFD